MCPATCLRVSKKKLQKSALRIFEVWFLQPPPPVDLPCLKVQPIDENDPRIRGIFGAIFGDFVHGIFGHFLERPYFRFHFRFQEWHDGKLESGLAMSATLSHALYGQCPPYPPPTRNHGCRMEVLTRRMFKWSHTV